MNLKVVTVLISTGIGLWGIGFWGSGSSWAQSSTLPAQPIQPIQSPQRPPSAATQQFDLGTLQLQQGTVIRASSSAAQAQYFHSDTVHPFGLTVVENIYDPYGRLLLPAGSEIYGQLLPTSGGLQYIATSMEINDKIYSMQARSDVLLDQKDPRQASAAAIGGDAAIGATAGLVLGAMTGGGVTMANLVGGAVGSMMIGNVTAPQVVVIQPGQSMDLTLLIPLRL